MNQNQIYLIEYRLSLTNLPEKTKQKKLMKGNVNESKYFFI